MAIRPRIQRSFLAWLEEARPRLALQARVLRRNDRRLTLTFVGVTSAISATLSRDEIEVWVTWRGAAWDILYSEYVSIAGHRGAYVCAACPLELRTLYPTREALWRDHMFEHFLGWTNRTLAPATHLILNGCDAPAGWTAARLWGQGDDPRLLEGAVAVLPVHVHGEPETPSICA